MKVRLSHLPILRPTPSLARRIVAELWRRILRRPRPPCGVCLAPAHIRQVVEFHYGHMTKRPLVVVMECVTCDVHHEQAERDLRAYSEMLVVTFTDMVPLGAFQ